MLAMCDKKAVHFVSIALLYQGYPLPDVSKCDLMYNHTNDGVQDYWKIVKQMLKVMINRS